MTMKKKISLLIALFLCSCHQSRTNDELVLIQIQDRNGLSETISNPNRLNAYQTVDFLSSQPYQKVLRVFRKDGKNHSTITTYHPNGTPWQLLECQEMRAFGTFCEWYPSGIKKIEATVIGGNAELSPGAQQSWLFDNTSLVWNEEGHLIASIQYVKGVLSGPSIYYYSSGVVEKEIPYSQDLVDGELNEYWEGGQIKTRAIYKNGLKDGISTSFWPSGAMRFEEKYVQDSLEEGRYFSLTSELLSEVKNKEGFRSLFDHEKLFQLQEIQNGQPEGLVRTFRNNGELLSTHFLKNGRKHGEEIEYFSRNDVAGCERSCPKISLIWDQGLIYGLVKTWYPTGGQQSQRDMCKNKRQGSSCGWYRNGSLMFVEEYENDELIKGLYYRKDCLEAVSSIVNGEGLATIYDPDGIFLRKVTYSNRKIVDPE